MPVSGRGRGRGGRGITPTRARGWRAARGGRAGAHATTSDRDTTLPARGKGSASGNRRSKGDPKHNDDDDDDEGKKKNSSNLPPQASQNPGKRNRNEEDKSGDKGGKGPKDEGKDQPPPSKRRFRITARPRPAPTHVGPDQPIAELTTEQIRQRAVAAFGDDFFDDDFNGAHVEGGLSDWDPVPDSGSPSDSSDSPPDSPELRRRQLYSAKERYSRGEEMPGDLEVLGYPPREEEDYQGPPIVEDPDEEETNDNKIEEKTKDDDTKTEEKPKDGNEQPGDGARVAKVEDDEEPEDGAYIPNLGPVPSTQVAQPAGPTFEQAPTRRRTLREQYPQYQCHTQMAFIDPPQLFHAARAFFRYWGAIVDAETSAAVPARNRARPRGMNSLPAGGHGWLPGSGINGGIRLHDRRRADIEDSFRRRRLDLLVARHGRAASASGTGSTTRSRGKLSTRLAGSGDPPLSASSAPGRVEGGQHEGRVFIDLEDLLTERRRNATTRPVFEGLREILMSGAGGEQSSPRRRGGKTTTSPPRDSSAYRLPGPGSKTLVGVGFGIRPIQGSNNQDETAASATPAAEGKKCGEGKKNETANQDVLADPTTPALKGNGKGKGKGEVLFKSPSPPGRPLVNNPYRRGWASHRTSLLNLEEEEEEEEEEIDYRSRRSGDAIRQGRANRLAAIRQAAAARIAEEDDLAWALDVETHVQEQAQHTVPQQDTRDDVGQMPEYLLGGSDILDEDDDDDFEDDDDDFSSADEDELLGLELTRPHDTPFDKKEEFDEELAVALGL